MGTAPRQKKTGASPRGTTKSAVTGSGSKSWLWLLTGFLLGAGSVALWFIDNHHAQPASIACGPTGLPSANSTLASQSHEPAPHFDFYNLLPGQPAVTSSSTQSYENQHVTHTPPPPPENSPQAGTVNSASPHNPPSTPSSYALQCGSFATLAEADSRRAAIIMLGFSAEVHPAKIANNQARYRVMVGPFVDHQKAAFAIHQLSRHGLASILVKKG
ncbi:MAG: hypothetical protein HKM02_04495 [Pseudomonadales bacterium]|nr:hypothetical protein [Pseudomonadales bacterium]